MKSAVCLIVKDEGRDLAEWLAFHINAGFDTILAYDNGSVDRTAAVLEAASAIHDVRLVDWPFPTGEAQCAAYRHALQTFGREFDWVAFIDSDEYLVLHPPHTLRSLLSGFDGAAVGVPWALFGSSGHVGFPPGLVTETFTRRADVDFESNLHVKCLVRPQAVRACINPHAFSVSGRTAYPDGKPLTWRHTPDGLQPGIAAARPNYAIAQINHYFTRSRAHWAAKTRRGYPNPLSRAKLDLFDAYDRNEVFDDSATRWSVPVRALRRAILNEAERVTGGRALATQDA